MKAGGLQPVAGKKEDKMPRGDYKPGEAADLGRAIYIKHIKPLMTEEDIGIYVAIDVDTGEYEMDIQRCGSPAPLEGAPPGSCPDRPKGRFQYPFQPRSPKPRRCLGEG